MKADMEAMKEKITTMMEAMMSMRRMMAVNLATVAAQQRFLNLHFSEDTTST